MIREAGCCTIILAALFAIEARAQALTSSRPATNVPADNAPVQHTFALTVPKGTPLQIALDREVRVKKEGQPLPGHLMQPVYAFDQLVFPFGTRVQGHISKIGRPSGKQLTWSVLNADFSPPRPIEVSFDQIVLAEGRHRYTVGMRQGRVDPKSFDLTCPCPGCGFKRDVQPDDLQMRMPSKLVAESSQNGNGSISGSIHVLRPSTENRRERDQ